MELTNKMIRDGVEYLSTNDDDRSRVGRYHHCQNIGCRDLNGASQTDVSGLTRVADRVNISQRDMIIQSKFTIGFEIEKNRLHRTSVKEYPLFAGFESDSSCGYEAVTNILPLVKPSIWRNKVYNMFHQAEKIIDEQYSPSNQKRNGVYTCGGHISVGVVGMSGEELMKKVRLNCGILYSLFRYRLKNTYTKYNASLLPYSDENGNQNRLITGYDTKYCVAIAKSNCLEFRLPTRVTSVNQLKRRYELFYALLDYSINKPRGTHENFLNSITQILLDMYEGNAEKVNEVKALAREFRKVLKTNKIHPEVARWFPTQRDNNNYTRTTRRMIADGSLTI